MALRILLAVISGYIFGNLNGAIITTGLLHRDDVRNHGSGNAGLTNFMRTYGSSASWLVLLIDVLKMVLAVHVGMCLLEYPGFSVSGKMLSGTACIIGHIFPLTYEFHGGKGVLSAAVLAFLVDWRIGAAALCVFLVVVAATRYVSLGSIAAGIVFPVLAFVLHPDWILADILTVITALLIVVMHRGNLHRLVNGTEAKLRFSGKGRKQS